MKTTKNLTSALLGVTMLAIPLTGAAQAYYGEHNRAASSAYEQLTAYPTGIVSIHDHDDWREHHHDGWKHRDRDDWRWRGHDRDDDARGYRDGYRPYQYRTVCDYDGDDCRQVRRFSPYYYR